MKPHLAALHRNLVAGARLALFLPVRPYDYRAAPLDYALLIAFNFALWVAAAAIRTGMAGEFDGMAVPIYLGGIPLVLATSALVAWIYGDAGRLLLIAVALTASDAVFELIALVMPPMAALAGLPRAGVLLILGWLWLISVRAVLVCGGTMRPQLVKGIIVIEGAGPTSGSSRRSRRRRPRLPTNASSTCKGS